VQRALSTAVLACAFLVAGSALGTPRPLPFTYTYETLGEGELEVEQYADLTPLTVPALSNAREFALASQFQTEFEYGITNRLELGLYLTLAPTLSSSVAGQSWAPLPEGNGTKQRLRYRLFDEGVLPIDIGLYGELTENEREFEIEAKVILQKRFGNLRIAANVVGEHEWYFASPQQDWIFDPSAGLTYQVTPVFQPGIESWMWMEATNQPYLTPEGKPGGATPFNNKPNVYVGPAVLFNFGKLWWSTGAYLRVTNFNHDLVPSVDAFGLVWFRTVIGISF
jgi:hypothetical protein